MCVRGIGGVPNWIYAAVSTILMVAAVMALVSDWRKMAETPPI